MRYSLLAMIAAAQLAIPHAAQASELDCDQPLFATDLDGDPKLGSKDALIDAANRGAPLRIGWGLDFDRDGTSELVHWADAAFLSIWEGEVFTQVDAIHTQSPVRGQANVDLREPFVEWRGSIGTTGGLEGVSSDGRRFSPNANVETMWCSDQPGPTRWVLLYRNGVDGEDLAGSKDALLAAIRSGQPIQIGWGFSREQDGQIRSVEHLIAPVFVTITNGSEVTAQLPEHIAQRSYADPARAFFDDPEVMWRGLMATTGTFDAVWVNRATGETTRRSPQRAALSWYAPASPLLDTPSLALPSGVTRDETRADERRPNQ